MEIIITCTQAFIIGVIGCPNQAILARFACFASFLCCVWFPASYALPASFHSSALHHPARLRLLDSHFPHDAGWRDALMVQGPMCHTLKTLIHACNQTRSYLILDQQQRQPNTIGCTIWACMSPSWTSSPSLLPINQHSIWREDEAKACHKSRVYDRALLLRTKVQ
jgi:hypothetical protein